MKKPYYLLFSCLFAIPAGLHAQFDQFVIGSLGGHFQSASGIQFTQSIGDLAGAHIQGSTAQFTQGFPQCPDCLECFISSTADVARGIPLRIYPNPASEWLQVETSSPDVTRYQLFNAQGILLAERAFTDSQIYVGELPGGIYLLRFTDEKGRWLATGRVLKL